MINIPPSLPEDRVLATLSKLRGQCGVALVVGPGDDLVDTLAEKVKEAIGCVFSVELGRLAPIQPMFEGACHGHIWMRDALDGLAREADTRGCWIAVTNAYSNTLLSEKAGKVIPMPLIAMFAPSLVIVATATGRAAVVKSRYSNGVDDAVAVPVGRLVG